MNDRLKRAGQIQIGGMRRWEGCMVGSKVAFELLPPQVRLWLIQQFSSVFWKFLLALGPSQWEITFGFPQALAQSAAPKCGLFIS